MASIDYSKSKIYKITNTENKIIYIGSTIQPLHKRFHTHRCYARTRFQESKFYLEMNNIGIEKFQIVLIKNFPCKDKTELHAEEYRIIQTYKPEELYNITIGLKNTIEQSKQHNELKHKKFELANQKLKEEILKKHNRKRGCICFDSKHQRYIFRGQKNNKEHWGTFSLYGYETLELAYLAAWDMRNEIFGYTNIDYLCELPMFYED